jgi:hypothetical protein
MFYLCYLKLITPTDSFQHDFYIKMMFVSLNRNMTCVLSPSKEHVFTLCFLKQRIKVKEQKDKQ